MNLEARGEFAAIDEQAFKAFHWRTTLTTGLGVFCDGYDLSSVALVLPLILASFGHASLTGAQSALLAASALVGAAAGAIGFGILGQKGRKRFYGVDVLILGLAAIAQAFSPSVGALIAIRFVLGIGVGADYVLSPVIMAEHANRADRGRALALGFGTMWPVGALFAALFDLVLGVFHVPADLRWRIVLAGGAVPALAVLYFRRQMPETARFLAKLAGERAHAAEVMGQISGREVSAPELDTRPFWSVFKAHARPILAAALLWMIYDLVVYAFILFGPSLIARSLGMGAISYSLLIQVIFVLPPSIIGSIFLIDRVGRKPLQVWGFWITAVLIVIFALMQKSLFAFPILALAVVGLANVAATGPGLVSGAGILGVELAPTRIRSVAQSVTVAGGRIGAAIAGFGFPLLFAGIGKAGAYYVIAALAAVGAILTWLLVPETGRISLEAISGEGAASPPRLEPAPSSAPS